MQVNFFSLQMSLDLIRTKKRREIRSAGSGRFAVVDLEKSHPKDL